MPFVKRDWCPYPAPRGAMGFSTYSTPDAEAAIEATGYFNEIAQQLKDLGAVNASGDEWSSPIWILSAAAGNEKIMIRRASANGAGTAVTLSDPDVT